MTDTRNLAKLRVALGQGAGAHRGVSADDVQRNGVTIRTLIGEAASKEARLPFNSLVVIDDHGTIIGRYDKRHISANEDAVYQLARGSKPLIFTVDGYRFGCLLCIEGMLPELIIEYENLDTDVLILATMTEGPSRSNEDKRVLALAEMADLWVMQPTPALHPGWLGGSVAWPGYRWLVRGIPEEQPSLVITELDLAIDDWRVRAGRERGRPWRLRQRQLQISQG